MLSILEQKLVNVGYDAFDTEEKNALIKELARREGIPYNQVTEDYILEIHKLLKVREFSLESDKIINQGFTSSNGHFYRTNEGDQANLIGKAVQLLLVPSIEQVFWKTEDVGYISHTREDWIKFVFIEGLAHKESTLFKYDTIKQAVQNASSHAELLQLQWDTWEAPVNGT